MTLSLKKNTIILVDDTTLLEDGFLYKLRDISKEVISKKITVKIFVDNEIDKKIKDFKDNNENKRAFLLDGIIDVLTELNLLYSVETNNYLDASKFIEVLKTETDATVYVITSKESVFHTFKDIKKVNDKSQILRYVNNGFNEWTEKKKDLKAFYLEEDEQYINKIDTDDIDYVYSPKYGYLKIDIDSKISGGEGSVYRTYNNMMAKIYNKNSITYTNYKKLSAMIDMNVYNQYICWPRDLLYVDGTFVGYLMDEVKNCKTLLNLRISNFSTMNHFERFKLCYNFLNNVKYLHEKGILIGDLKPDNILVKSPEEVYFIDCGCYQIDDYSCPVCHPEYTKREFKKDELKQQLRTEEDEYYPINKMAFEILLKKDHTYDPDNIEIENQDKTKFSYPLNVDKYKRETEDAMIWKFLTPTMREYFYYYFKQGKITPLSEWVNELNLFIKKNEKGK